MERRKTAFVIMGIEQRELLMPMHHIDRVIDIERHRVRWSAVARTIERSTITLMRRTSSRWTTQER